MLPNINANGRSFRGAGAYHLHDKGSALDKFPATSDRVAWTATRNLVNDDPELAIDEMWRTAEMAAHLKQLSGHDARGRKCEDPVKTLSLSWKPHQSPTREEMEAAADSFLKAMGWQEHQALLICHTDTAHPHLHVILNRVHPETGMVLKDWREQPRSQQWGDRYDKEQGLILCPARAEKYAERRFDLRLDGMPYPFAKLAQEQDRAFDNSLAEATVQDLTEKDLLKARHQAEREDFLESGKAKFREARQAAYRAVRDEFKPRWREYFKEERQTNDALDDAARFHHRDVARLCREGDHEGAAQAWAEFDRQREATRAELAERRKDLREEQLDLTRESQDIVCRGLIESRAEAFQGIKDRQKEERAEFKELTALRDSGQPYDIDRLQELIGGPERGARVGENISPEKVLQAAHRNEGLGTLLPEMVQQHDSGSPFFHSLLEGATAEPAARDSTDGATGEPGPRRNPVDAIASAISLGISLLEGLTTPSSPLDRARAKVQAVRHEEEMPVLAAELREQKIKEDFTRYALTAVREAAAEEERERKLDHEERDRGQRRYLER